MPSLGYITFESYDPHFAFTCLLGDGAANPTDGYGGWSTTPRARRRALTDWMGNNPLTIDIPILFDDFAGGDGVKIEHDIRQLEKMAGLDIDQSEPPLLTFDSAGVVPHDAHDATQNDWVISNIQWGDSDRNQFGNRVRQAATVTVMTVIEDDALSAASSAQRRRKQNAKRAKKGQAQKGAKQKRYVVKTNENLEKIAAHTLGASKRWRELVKLNPKIRDPKKIIPMGTIIKLP